MPKSDPSDENSVLIKKLKHACSTYDTASKKYLTAVKELDSAMESIAIAIRELAQGEENPGLRAKADHLCTSVDRHMAGQAGAGAGGGGRGSVSKSHRASAEASAMSAVDPDNYTFVSYMNDFTREVSVAIDELRESLKTAEKAKSAHNDMTSRYNKKRTAVSDLETKLAKKNQGISDNPKFAQKVVERDAAKASLDTETEKYNSVYSGLLQKRSQTLQRVVDGLNKYTAKYYDSLAKTIST